MDIAAAARQDPQMSLFSTLRSKWRRHDERLAERAYRDGDIWERLEEHEHVMNSGLLGANPVGRLISAQQADRAADRAIRSEDALEHEEPR
jgi:hypothetical protein